jgi:hypothetical protein
MGDSKSNGVIRTIEHPWAKILIAIMSTGAFTGMGAGLIEYVEYRHTAALHAKQAELTQASRVKDVELQILALVEMMAEQGNQLKAFKEILEKLSNGHRWGAREDLKDVEIPLSQGKRILRGRAVPSYEDVRAEQTKISLELEDVEELLAK